MCVGIPMQVAEMLEATAWCEGNGRRELINMLLVGEQPLGTWVLTFQGAALRVMEAEEAGKTNDALQALAQTMQGDASQIDVLFADLVNREPQLPPHLQNLHNKKETA